MHTCRYACRYVSIMHARMCLCMYICIYSVMNIVCLKFLTHHDRQNPLSSGSSLVVVADEPVGGVVVVPLIPVPPSLFQRTVMHAPYSNNSVHRSSNLLIAAMCSGVISSTVWALACAPCFNSKSAVVKTTPGCLVERGLVPKKARTDM